jgi:hypothetical protein
MGRENGVGVAGRDRTVHQKPAAWTRLNSSTVTSSPYTHGVPAWTGDRSHVKYHTPKMTFITISKVSSWGLLVRIDGTDAWS